MKKAKSIKIPLTLIQYNQYLQDKSDSEQGLISLSDNPTIDSKKLECIKKGPKNIHDLNDGLLFDAYEFTKEDKGKLGFLGFANINFNNFDKIIVVEYSQTGSYTCEGERLKFGVGARMLMKIKKTGFGAKLDSPYQIAASVIYGKANVSFSVKTFGIVGPGVERLIKSGSLQEDTYTRFVNDIANLIVEAYQDNGKLTVTPQPLFLTD